MRESYVIEILHESLQWNENIDYCHYIICNYYLNSIQKQNLLYYLKFSFLILQGKNKKLLLILLVISNNYASLNVLFIQNLW
jgi:hypothetical protein